MAPIVNRRAMPFILEVIKTRAHERQHQRATMSTKAQPPWTYSGWSNEFVATPNSSELEADLITIALFRIRRVTIYTAEIPPHRLGSRRALPILDITCLSPG